MSKVKFRYQRKSEKQMLTEIDQSGTVQDGQAAINI